MAVAVAKESAASAAAGFSSREQRKGSCSCFLQTSGPLSPQRAAI